MFSASEANLVANYYLIYRMTVGFSHDISGKCTKLSYLNHYYASRRAICIYNHAVMNYLKKYFWTQKSDKLPDSGPELPGFGFGRFEILKCPFLVS